MSASNSIDIKRCLIDTVLAGLISLIVFGPIVGIVLQGYSFDLHPQRLAILVGIVMAGRFCLSLFLQTPQGKKIAHSMQNRDSGVHVLPAGHKSTLRFVIPVLILLAICFPFFANK